MPKKNKKDKIGLPLGMAKKMAKLFWIFAGVIAELELNEKEIEVLARENGSLSEKLKKIILEVSGHSNIEQGDVLDEKKISDIAFVDKNPAAAGVENKFSDKINPGEEAAPLEVADGGNDGNAVRLEESKDGIVVVAGEYPDLTEKLSRFYSEVFEMKVNFSGIKIPERRRSSDWSYNRLLIISKGMIFSKIYSGFRKFSHISIGFSDDLLAMLGVETKKVKKQELSVIYKERVIPALDTIVRSARNTEENYAFWVCEDLISDKECVDMSANKLNLEKLPTLSLEERILHELFTLWEKGSGYYGKDDVSVCADSRFIFAEGHETVPKFGWYEGNIVVGWHSPSKISPNIRAHRVIVL